VLKETTDKHLVARGNLSQQT